MIIKNYIICNLILSLYILCMKKNMCDKLWLVNVESQIIAQTQVEAGDGPNKPNTINL